MFLSNRMRSLLCSCAARGSAALRIAHASRLPLSSKQQRQPASSSSSSSGGSPPRRWTSSSSPRPTIAAAPSTSPSSGGGGGREHPAFPRVGVAAVLFRPRAAGEREDSEPSLLLIRRAREPNAGLWSFPGGALELGEALVAGAERELGEEVPGLKFERDASVAGELAGGVAFAAADSIHYGDDDDGDGQGGAGGEQGEKRPPRFHWAIVEVAAVAKASSGSSGSSGSPFPLLLGPSAPAPPAADDASASRWIGALSELRRLEEEGEVTPGCARVAAEAVRRFGGALGIEKTPPRV